jgi:hypothetical protein
MSPDDLIRSVQTLSTDELEKLIQKRVAENKALHVLWRAALALEREERRQQREEDPAHSSR